MPHPGFHYLPPSPADGSPAQWLLARRKFLLALAAGTTLASSRLGAEDEASASPRLEDPADLGAEINASLWPTLAAVQDQLLPSEPGAPGAREVHAIAYLKGALERPRAPARDRDFLLAGARWLRGRSANEFNGRAFVALSDAQREQMLHRMDGTTDGRNWILLMLYYVIEAVLTDPIYGGNPDGIGWKWLNYVPGYPRPPAGRRYYEYDT